MFNSKAAPHPEELLNKLGSLDFLANFHLSLYSCSDKNTGPQSATCDSCGIAGDSSICTTICLDTITGNLQDSITKNKTSVFQCQAGLLGFAVPLGAVGLPGHCLVARGYRSRSFDLRTLESVARAGNIDPVLLLKRLEQSPVTTEDEVAATANRLSSLLPTLLRDDRTSRQDSGTMERLAAIVGVSAEIDRTGSVDEAVSLLCETLSILFEVPALAVALPDRDGRSFHLHLTLGIPADTAGVAAGKLAKLTVSNTGTRIQLSEEEIEDIFPSLEATSATCIPLVSADNLQGMVFFFDKDLPAGDLHLIELVAGRTASRLLSIKQADEFGQENIIARNLLDMVGTLADIDDQNELFKSILDMAAALVHASTGSLMLMDETGESLRIVAAVGMNLQLARSLCVNVGSGVAGKVALNGHPLLVNDIENDTRIATINRPRFTTKSFISIPLKFKGNILGVLNLSDKNGRENFTDADLNNLVSFGAHTISMIRRNRFAARTEELERLSITDPLTELYNRRFLEKRMEEELSRSMRYNLHVTVMIIDLDTFKIYNDYCGHIAGDKALKKTSRLLLNSIREMDLAARYGGEEFCIILPGASKKESIFVAERIRRSIENEKFTGEDNLPLGRLTASIGISSYPEDGSTFGELIHKADIALYQAKSGGRNRVVLSQTNPALPSHCEASRGTPQRST